MKNYEWSKYKKQHLLTCWYQKGKPCYDKRGATTAANLRFKKHRIKLRSYWCDKCNFWHLTKQVINKFMENTEEAKEEVLEPDEVLPETEPVTEEANV